MQKLNKESIAQLKAILDIHKKTQEHIELLINDIQYREAVEGLSSQELTKLDVVLHFPNNNKLEKYINQQEEKNG